MEKHGNWPSAIGLLVAQQKFNGLIQLTAGFVADDSPKYNIALALTTVPIENGSGLLLPNRKNVMAFLGFLSYGTAESKFGVYTNGPNAAISKYKTTQLNCGFQAIRIGSDVMGMQKVQSNKQCRTCHQHPEELVLLRDVLYSRISKYFLDKHPGAEIV